MINRNLIDEFSKLLVDSSIQNAIPINPSGLNVNLEYKLGYIFLNISIVGNKDFYNAIVSLARKTAQSIVEDNSLDGIGLNIEVI